MDAPRSTGDALAVKRIAKNISPIRFSRAFAKPIEVGRAKRIISYTWVLEHFY
jgi:hypothetical protein